MELYKEDGKIYASVEINVDQEINILETRILEHEQHIKIAKESIDKLKAVKTQ